MIAMARPASLLFAVFLCCASVRAQEAAVPPAVEAAPTIDLPLPWKTRGVLRYAMEQLETKQSAKDREKTLATSITELRTQRAGKAGYEIHWVSSDVTHKTLEGDAALGALLEPAMKKMEGTPMVVVLKEDGTYEAVRNIEQIASRLREVLAPVARAALDAGAKASPAGELTEAQRKAASEQAQVFLDNYIDGITSPKVLDAMISRQARNIAFFNGGGLEDGASYALDTELENPTGGPNFPSKLTFGLWVSEEDEEDVYIEWKSSIDPEKGAGALIETAKRLFGADLPLDPKELSGKVAIEDAGFMLVHRPTGKVELYEDERTVTFGDVVNYERNRMRLLEPEDGHGHDWKQAPPTAAGPASGV